MTLSQMKGEKKKPHSSHFLLEDRMEVLPKLGESFVLSDIMEQWTIGNWIFCFTDRKQKMQTGVEGKGCVFYWEHTGCVGELYVKTVC